MAYSGSLGFNLTVQSISLTTLDDLEFRLVSEYRPATGNYTASLSPGSLTLSLQSTAFGQLPYATSSQDFGNFIEAIGQNTITLNENISSFHGNYQQVPYFISGSFPNETIVTSSLYYQYGDISYPFDIGFGDKIVMYGTDGRYQILTVFSINYIADSNLVINTIEDIYSVWQIDYTQVVKFLLVKKVKDEQNIILEFKKPPGATSYGFLISDDVDPNLLQKISTIQTNVQNQLLSTQQNSG